MQYNDRMRSAALALKACTLVGAAAAAAAAEVHPGEGAVRESDAAWSAAANTGNLDAWMAFCAPEAIVFLPHQPLVSGVASVREAVSNFMGLGRVAVRWHSTAIEMARGGKLAQVLGTYELAYTRPGGTAVVERGTRLDIWRQQSDGSWKAILDSWSGATGTANSPAPAPVPPPADAPPVSAPVPAPVPAGSTRYGDAPVNYLESIRGYFQEHLKDPESLQYGEVTVPERGSMKGTSGSFLMSETVDYGWIVRADVNARNAGGRYVGFKSYRFLFRGEKLLRAVAPLPAGETN